MKTINFKFQGNHESHSGDASIIDLNYHNLYQSMVEEAKSAFESEDVTVRSIGKVTTTEHAQAGYTDTYEIYETYVDSGSDDYYYYAIAIYSEEL